MTVHNLDDAMNSSVLHPPIPAELMQAAIPALGKQSIATRIKQRRTALGLNQVQLAKLATVTQARVSEVENGARSYRIDTLLRIIDALGLQLSLDDIDVEDPADMPIEEMLGLAPRQITGSLPHSNCYQIPNSPILVGSYPGHPDKVKGRNKLDAILECGVDYFIDLTVASDNVRPYEELLAEIAGDKIIEYRSFPIAESSTPSPQEMNEILDAIDAAVGAFHVVYLHCRGGIGRSGTVVGCHLVRHGMTGEEALAEVQGLFESFSPVRVAAHPEGSPQHDSQRELVRNWGTHDTKAPDIDYTVLDPGRRSGALVGLAVGDALGTTLEFTPHGTVSPISDMVGGGPFRLLPGQWTDDTSMALCLADGLLEKRRFDPTDQMQRYLRWLKQGYRSSTGLCFDVGVTTRDAIARFQRSNNPFAGSTDTHSAGNGSLMRLAPVVIFFEEDPELAIRMAAESSRTTHGARAAVDACRYFAGLMLGAFRGERRETILSPMYCPVPGLWDREPLDDSIARVALGSFKSNQVPGEIGAAGYVVNTLNLALWAFHRATDFRAGALKAVNIGGDADTTGAVYGQIAGAYFGVEKIPEAWCDLITSGSEIRQMGYDLSGGPDAFPPVRREEAKMEARKVLAWAGGDYNTAIKRLDRALDEMGYGGSLAGRAVVERAKNLLIERRLMAQGETTGAWTT